MTRPAEYSFIRYLAAKKNVDDRALNHQVREALRQTLDSRPFTAPLSVLEIGCGIGTMVERLLAWGILTEARYTGIDLDLACIVEARRRLKLFAAQKGLVGEESSGSLALRGKNLNLTLAFEPREFFAFAAQEAGRSSFDLVVAHAFLDLVDLKAAFPLLFSLLNPGGWFYFTLNFDGATILLPPLTPGLDEQIEALYHQTMVRRGSDGKLSSGSTTGRRLFGVLRAVGAEVLAAGSSDWVVFPQGGGYPEDEAYFLHFMIHTISQALAGHPDIDQQAFKAWIDQRHAQIEAGRLIYVARQLDFFGRIP